MPEVKATLTGDSSSYTESFKKAEEAHETFSASEHRVVATMQNIAREAFTTTNPIETAAGSIGHLSHLLGNEFAEGAAGTISILGFIAVKMFEVHQQAEQMKQDFADLHSVMKFGSSESMTDMGSETLNGKASEAKSQTDAIVKEVEDPAVSARIERGWKRLLYYNPFDGANYDDTVRDEIAKRVKLAEDAFAELAHRKDEQNELTMDSENAKYKGPEAQTEIKKKQLDLQYEDQIKQATDNQDIPGAQALQRELDMKKAIIDLDDEHNARVQAEDVRHNAAVAETIKLKSAGYAEQAKSAEELEAFQHASNTRSIQGVPDNGSVAIFNAQVAAEQQVVELAREHLDAETEIAYIIGPRGERAIDQAKAEVVEIQRQRDLLVDKTQWMEKNLELVKAQQSLTDQEQQREIARRQLQEQGSLLDIQYKYENVNGQDERNSPQAKLEQNEAKLAALVAKLADPTVNGDPNAQASVLNEMKSLRNEAAVPIDRLGFDGTSQMSVGGGRAGSSASGLLEATKEQTKFLEDINKSIQDLTKQMATKTPKGMT